MGGVARWRARALLVLAGLLIVAGAAVATGSIPSSDGTIFACYKKVGGALRVIDRDANGHCVAGKENPLQWSQGGGDGGVKIDYRESAVLSANPPRTVVFQQGGLVLKAGCGAVGPFPFTHNFIIEAKSESDDAHFRITWHVTDEVDTDGGEARTVTFADEDFDNGEEKAIGLGLTGTIAAESAADGTVVYSRADGGQVTGTLQALAPGDPSVASSLRCIIGGIAHVAP